MSVGARFQISTKNSHADKTVFYKICHFKVGFSVNLLSALTLLKCGCFVLFLFFKCDDDTSRNLWIPNNVGNLKPC